MKTKLFTIILSMGMVLPMFGQQFAITVFEDCEQNGAIKSSTGGEDHGYTYVDLGLSVYWATMNVGATKPEESGNYYVWGEVTTRTDYRNYQSTVVKYIEWEQYTANLSTNYRYYPTKYCTASSSRSDGSYDDKTILEPDDDVAHVDWGSNWRMPTLAELQELRDNCTWEWKTINNVKGCLITSKKEGYTENSIFLPGVRYMSGTSLYTSGGLTYIWTSSLYPTDALYAYGLICSDSYGEVVISISSIKRCNGLPVRPVLPKE